MIKVFLPLRERSGVTLETMFIQFLKDIEKEKSYLGVLSVVDIHYAVIPSIRTLSQPFSLLYRVGVYIHHQ